MQATNILILIIGLGAFAFFLGRGRSIALGRRPWAESGKLHSLPSYYGAACGALWCALPSLVLLGHVDDVSTTR